MARTPRPRGLAVGFGLYFLVIALFSWQFASGLATPWYPIDLTRWIYSTYMIVSAIFLVGLGGLGLSLRRSFGEQMRGLEGRGSPRGNPTDALPPPLPEPAGARDPVDRDIDELLESLSEVEASAQQEAEALDLAPEASARVPESDAELDSLWERLLQRRKLLGRYLLGPGLVAAFILGLSGMMLPGADGFAQFNHQLNTALILGIGYAWIGVGSYIAATVYALVSEGRRR